MSTADASALRLALWGTFDIADFGSHLLPRIFEQEVHRRLPTARVQAFSPLGHLHPLPFDGGHLVEPLGEWSPERLSELAKGHDLIAIGGGELIHTQDDAYAAYYDTGVEEARRLQPSRFFIEGLGPELEASCPVAWHSVGIPFDLNEESAARLRSALEKRPYVSVRDDVSRDRLLRAGVRRDVVVVPDSAFLVDRVFDADVIDRRLAYLRGIESYPAEEQPIVIQGSRALLPHAESIGRSLSGALAKAGGVPVVILETGPCHGDEAFAEAIAPYLSGAVYRMPGSPLVEDIVAAIAHSRGFVGVSFHGSVIAFARGLPGAILDLGLGYSQLAGFATLVRGEDTLVRETRDLLPALRRVLSGTPPWDGLGEIASRIDSHFDLLAELAERSASEPSDRPASARRAAAATARDGIPEDETALWRAFEARGRRLVEQRSRLGAEIERLEQELAQLDEERRRYLHEIDSYKSEIDSYKSEAAKMWGELQRLANSRSIRYTAPFRAFFGRLRRLVR
jgi:hypothetical protein